MPRRQKGIPAQPVHVVTGRTAEKAVQSPACKLVLEQAWLSDSEKETSLSLGFGCRSPAASNCLVIKPP